MRRSSYWITLLIVYAATLLCALLTVFTGAMLAVSQRNESLFGALFLLPVIAGPVVLAITLARSPWLRDHRVWRVVMIVGGTLGLSGLYLLMYAAYSQGVGVYARHFTEYLRNAF